MRYHYEKPSIYIPIYGETFACDHPVYDKSTLFKIENSGLSVIQQRYDKETKKTWWGEIDPWIANDLYLNPNFKKFFEERSNCRTDGLYPTVTVRQIMWALKMKPLPKERWESVFDRRMI